MSIADQLEEHRDQIRNLRKEVAVQSKLIKLLWTILDASTHVDMTQALMNACYQHPEDLGAEFRKLKAYLESK